MSVEATRSGGGSVAASIGCYVRSTSGASHGEEGEEVEAEAELHPLLARVDGALVDERAEGAADAQVHERVEAEGGDQRQVEDGDLHVPGGVAAVGAADPAPGLVAARRRRRGCS